jgi:hypothetical protein
MSVSSSQRDFSGGGFFSKNQPPTSSRPTSDPGVKQQGSFVGNLFRSDSSGPSVTSPTRSEQIAKGAKGAKPDNPGMFGSLTNAIGLGEKNTKGAKGAKPDNPGVFGSLTKAIGLGEKNTKGAKGSKGAKPGLFSDLTKAIGLGGDKKQKDDKDSKLKKKLRKLLRVKTALKLLKNSFESGPFIVVYSWGVFMVIYLFSAEMAVAMTMNRVNNAIMLVETRNKMIRKPYVIALMLYNFAAIWLNVVMITIILYFMVALVCMTAWYGTQWWESIVKLLIVPEKIFGALDISNLRVHFLVLIMGVFMSIAITMLYVTHNDMLQPRQMLLSKLHRILFAVTLLMALMYSFFILVKFLKSFG